MNIEILIPKETEFRDDYIKNIVLPNLPIGIGLDQQNIYFNFKTYGLLAESKNIITYKNLELVSFEKGIWTIVSLDRRDYLPKEYLLEIWHVR
jgi:hypothetical protein